MVEPPLTTGRPPGAEPPTAGGVTPPAKRTVRGVLFAISRWIGIGEQVVGGLLITAILVLILLQVVSRETAVPSYPWTGELARMSLVWLTFAVMGHLTGRDEHVKLQFIDHVVRGSGQRYVDAFSKLVVAGISIGFVVQAQALVRTLGLTGQALPASGIDVKWVFVMPLVGFSLTALRALLGLFLGGNG